MSLELNEKNEVLIELYTLSNVIIQYIRSNLIQN